MQQEGLVNQQEAVLDKQDNRHQYLTKQGFQGFQLEMKRFNGDLRELLDGPAEAVIAGYETTNANYAEALDVLKDRYGNKSVIQLATFVFLR